MSTGTWTHKDTRATTIQNSQLTTLIKNNAVQMQKWYCKQNYYGVKIATFAFSTMIVINTINIKSLVNRTNEEDYHYCDHHQIRKYDYQNRSFTSITSNSRPMYNKSDDAYIYHYNRLQPLVLHYVQYGKTQCNGWHNLWSTTVVECYWPIHAACIYSIVFIIYFYS